MTAQILAAVIFVGMFALIIMDKFERQYVTLGSAALVLVVVFGICMHSWDAIKNALNLGAIFRADFWYGASESASSGVNWSTIFFITGMMIMVEGLGKSGFFRWLCLSLGTDLGGNATPIGASANVVATSVSAKSGHPISWGKYCKYCVPATVLVIAVSLGCLFLRYL